MIDIVTRKGKEQNCKRSEASNIMRHHTHSRTVQHRRTDTQHIPGAAKKYHLKFIGCFLSNCLGFLCEILHIYVTIQMPSDI